MTLTRWTHTPGVDERHPQPLAKGEFTYLRNAEGLDTRLGMGWLDSTTAVDTVVRYRTFTQLRRACVACARHLRARPQQRGMGHAARRTNQRRVLGLLDLSALHAQPTAAATPKPMTCPTPAPCPGQGLVPDQIDYRNYVFEVEKEAPNPNPVWMKKRTISVRVSQG